MNKYLIEILKIQSSVILPGLGALMVPSQKSGNVVFNPHLKFNDGSLAKFISEKEGIELQEAQNRVAKFVREIEAEIGKGNSYDMFEFGRFFKNKDGQVDFQMHSDKSPIDTTEKPVEKKAPILTPADILSNDKKAEEIAAEKVNAAKKEAEAKAAEAKAVESKAAEAAKIAEEKVNETSSKKEAEAKKALDELKKAEEVAKKEKERLEKEASKKIEETKEKIEDKKEELADKAEAIDDKIAAVIPTLTTAESKVDKPVVDTNPLTDSSNKNKEDKISLDKQSKNKYTPSDTVIGPDSKPEDKVVIVPPVVEVVVEEKKKRSKLPWLILLLFLIGLGIAGFFYKDQILAYFNKGEHPEVADSTAVTNDADHAEDLNAVVEEIDTTYVEETPVEEIVEEVVEEKIKPVVSGTNSGSYHLIGNAFEEKENAERYATEMQGKGYPAMSIGRYDGLYLVSLKSYDSREAANAGRSTVASDASSAWVFKK